MFPADVTELNRHVSCAKRAGRIYYFNGPMPVFSHEEKDLASFRMFPSQFCHDGNCTPAEIARAYGVSTLSLKRYVRQFRQAGIKGFYARPGRRGPGVLTPEVLQRVQSRLDEGQGISEIAAAFKLKADTLHKAVRSGRLKVPVKKSPRRRPAPAARVSAAEKTARPSWAWAAPGRWSGWPRLWGN